MSRLSSLSSRLLKTSPKIALSYFEGEGFVILVDSPEGSAYPYTPLTDGSGFPRYYPSTVSAIRAIQRFRDFSASQIPLLSNDVCGENFHSRVRFYNKGIPSNPVLRTEIKK